MAQHLFSLRRASIVWAIGACLVATGCQMMSSNLGGQIDEVVAPGMQQYEGPDGSIRLIDGELAESQASRLPGREKAMVSLPAYRIEPPDILLIDAIRMAPKPPYYVQTLDVLQIVVQASSPDRALEGQYQPIAGQYQVEPSGMINLGAGYGSITAAGRTIDEITEAVAKKVRGVLQVQDVSVSLIQSSGQQVIQGEHLVGPDGTVNLGSYGSVYVAGMTLEEGKVAIEEHLSKDLDTPKISLDVFAYNSKVYYVIIEGAGTGDKVFRVPVTGNETVLDAIAQIGGLMEISSKEICIARPAPSGVGCDQILRVDWQAITKGAATATNYQILPGDRVFIPEDRMVAFDALVSKVTRPFERMFGFTLLGVQTIQTAQRFPEGQRTGF